MISILINQKCRKNVVYYPWNILNVISLRFYSLKIIHTFFLIFEGYYYYYYCFNLVKSISKIEFQKLKNYVCEYFLKSK